MSGRVASALLRASTQCVRRHVRTAVRSFGTSERRVLGLAGIAPLYSRFVIFYRTYTAVAPAAPATEGLPPSLERVGNTEAYPKEYPGQVYAFNWCLNGDGVTPVNKSAFRITKPLDLKVAGLAVPKKSPLSVSLNVVCCCMLNEKNNPNRASGCSSLLSTPISLVSD